MSCRFVVRNNENKKAFNDNNTEIMSIGKNEKMQCHYC
jgi:hypothetical protein